jgi:hypothetical protein
MNKYVVLRYVSNIILLCGNYFLLFSDEKLGLLFFIISPLFAVSYYIKTKMWDTITVATIFFVMDFEKLIQVLSHK